MEALLQPLTVVNTAILTRYYELLRDRNGRLQKDITIYDMSFMDYLVNANGIYQFEKVKR